jgi:hypothetical protein
MLEKMATHEVEDILVLLPQVILLGQHDQLPNPLMLPRGPPAHSQSGLPPIRSGPT